MSSDEAVRKASGMFYSALNRMANGDGGSLADIWSHGTAVTAMHPIGGRMDGWRAVRDSFDQVAKLASKGSIELKEQHIEVSGDMAYEVGVESGHFTMAGQRVDIDHRVTNIYRREGGGWKIVHHHTDVAPAMLDVLATL